MDLTIIDAFWAAGAVLWVAVGGMALVHVRKFSNRLADAFCRAPGLDVIVASFTWVPPVVAGVTHGWTALVACILGQVVGLVLWCRIHEWCNRRAASGPRIVKYLNQRVGWFGNHAALWVTSLSVPMFWAVRFAEILTYPMLVWLVKLPRYKTSEWVNVSRQKYDGLIGHDLIWCLYCDWMTGVWSLGTEMLRNVESFWCPIRFYDGKKCENCKIDFPDIEEGWTPADGTMSDVVETLGKYFDGGDHSWYGHPCRACPKTNNCETDGGCGKQGCCGGKEGRS